MIIFVQYSRVEGRTVGPGGQKFSPSGTYLGHSQRDHLLCEFLLGKRRRKKKEGKTRKDLGNVCCVLLADFKVTLFNFFQVSGGFLSDVQEATGLLPVILVQSLQRFSAGAQGNSVTQTGRYWELLSLASYPVRVSGTIPRDAQEIKPGLNACKN